MDIIKSIIGIIPILLSMTVIVFFKKNTILGALSGIILCLIIVPIWFPLSWGDFHNAISTTLILTISAALVIIPGLYLNAILQGQGTIEKLSEFVKNYRMNDTHKALLLLIAFLPAIESLTGFGVSLFLSIPLFFRLFPIGKAYRLSIIGMNIMPWGTLGLATVVGSSLSGESVNKLSAATALISIFVFPAFGLIGAYIIDESKGIRENAILATIMGLSLSSLIYICSLLGLTELAGVISGTIVGVSTIFFLRARSQISHELGVKPVGVYDVFMILMPYVVLLSLILISRLVNPIHELLSSVAILKTSRIKLAVFNSPGLFVGIVAFIWFSIKNVKLSHGTILNKSKTACLSLFLFAFLAQLMRESGMITAFSSLASSIAKGKIMYVFIVPLLGMVSGNITGSNVGGNALMMTLQHDIGKSVGHGLLFASVQNGAAGYAVFTSSAIIVLSMTIAKNFDYDGFISEHQLVSFSLKSALFIYIAIVLGFAMASFFGM
jgi:lactate permease